MNAKKLNEIFERQGIGHVKLVRPFFDSDGSTEVHAIVVDDNGNDLQATDKWHYASIEINSNTFGYDAENEISEQDYEDYNIGDLRFHSTAWAYPHATINEIGGGIDCVESNCGIYLTDYKEFDNYPSLVDVCTEQACKMFKEPLEYQNWLLKMLLEEQTIFIEKHYPMLQSLGFRMLTSDLYKRGFQGEYTSEIWFEFVSKSGRGHLFIHQDLFDGRLVITTSKPKECQVAFLENPNVKYRYYVNDLSVDELKKLAMDILDRCSDEMWCEERDFRDKWNKEHGFDDRFKEQHSTYTIDEFFKHKGLPTQKEMLDMLKNIKEDV